MRHRFLIAASLVALLCTAENARPQAQSQGAPDAPQRQASKSTQKTPPDAPTPQTSVAGSSGDAPAAKPSSKTKDNAFPEAVSRDAAKKAAQSDDTSHSEGGGAATQAPAGKDDNAFPEAVSRDAAKKAQADDQPGKSSTGNANPFPEDVSRGAAKAAGNDSSSTTIPRNDLPPGVSSSQSQGSAEDGRVTPDPVRSKKDAEVGAFYIKTGNYQGALLRFQDASASDPTNVAAIFGLAEAQQALGKAADAAKNYQMYLEIVPNGPKAKDAMKALKTLQAAR